jgi:hypothetical protein
MKKFGEIMVDHRASPGIPEDEARLLGYEPEQVKEGTLFEAATMTCAHCNRPVVKNPLRTRERYYCMSCGGDYICDMCNIERMKPDYQHLPFRQIVDLAATGEATVVSLGVRPLLVMAKKREL